MLRYTIRRFLATIPVLIGISLLTFSILHLVPGDPAMAMLGEMATSQEAVANMRAKLGLNDPLPVQYLRYMTGVLHGDFGVSWLKNQSVSKMIASNFPATLVLTAVGLGLAIVLGVVLGTLAAVKVNTWMDSACMGFALIGVSAPSFWLGLMLIFIFSFKLTLLPSTGAGGWRYLVMPAFTLGVHSAALIARLVRASVLDVIRSDYVRTARAKGVLERRVIIKHVLRNALIPVVTIIGLQFGRLLSGAVVIETVFSRPGLGRLMVTAILAKDFQVVQGAVFFSAMIYVLANLLVDVSYAAIDPRITYS